LSPGVGGLLVDQVSYTNGLVPGLFILAIALLAPFFILGLVRFRRAPSRRLLAAVIATSIALSAVSIAYGYELNRAYVSSHTWSYSFYLYVRTNNTGPDAIVVPSVVDEALLAGLSVTSGTANWSFVDTEQGRGIYVGFTGVATLSASVSRYPAPNPLPDTRWTMTNESVWTPDLWIYYPGTAGIFLSLEGSLWCSTYVRPGWNLYPTTPMPVAMT
jgi:hypothetical protein